MLNVLKLKILFIVFIITLSSAFSQRQYYNWYFGNYAGLTFNTKSGEPNVLTDGKVYTNEGTSVISDYDGNLLFYTDGSSIWNKNHKTMFNGENLSGCFSSTQSALIVPKPGDKNIYYVFTTDCYENLSDFKGLNYSIVDVTAQNGNGEVTQKNIKLLDYCTERLAAIKHPNGTDIWVITQDLYKKCFSAFLVTADGVQMNPIESKATIKNEDVIGYMKISPTGEKIAFASYFQGTLNLYDFDIHTGIITNEIILDTPSTKEAYGLEFSGNGKYLYVSYLNPYNYRLSQYSALSTNAANLEKSEKILTTDQLDSFGALQMAPNRKIYTTNFNTKYLSVINKPDLLGADCDLTVNSFYLSAGEAVLGLPINVVNYDELTTINVEIIKNGGDILCKDGTLELSANTDYASYYWSTGEKSKSIIITSGGNYYLKVIDSYGNTDSTSILIEEVGDDIKFSEEKYDFGKVQTNSVTEHSFTIKNNENIDLKIENIQIKNNPEYFKINYISMPYVLKANKSLKISVTFEPDKRMNLTDSVEIVFAVPCLFTDYISLKATCLGDVSVKFWIPDTTGRAGDRNFKMPLYSLISDKIDTSFITNINAVIKFNKTLYYSDSISKGKLAKNSQDENLIFNLFLEDVEIKDDTTNITNLIGNVLFNYPGATPFSIESLILSNPYLKYESQNGSLTIDNVCVKNIRGIQIRDGSYLSVKNNAQTGMDVIAHSKNEGLYSIDIYSINGERVFTDNWFAGEKSEKSFRVSELLTNSGLYFAVFKAPEKVDALPITFIK